MQTAATTLFCDTIQKRDVALPIYCLTGLKKFGTHQQTPPGTNLTYDVQCGRSFWPWISRWYSTCSLQRHVYGTEFWDRAVDTCGAHVAHISANDSQCCTRLPSGTCCWNPPCVLCNGLCTTKRFHVDTAKLAEWDAPMSQIVSLTTTPSLFSHVCVAIWRNAGWDPFSWKPSLPRSCHSNFT